MGLSYSNPNPSPAPLADSLSFSWRHDIREYDTNNFKKYAHIPFYLPDLEVVLSHLSKLPHYRSALEPNWLWLIIISVIIHVGLIIVFGIWTHDTNGKYLYLLALLPIYVALAAATPYILAIFVNIFLTSNAHKRKAEIKSKLSELSKRYFDQRGIELTYQDNFVITVTKK